MMNEYEKHEIRIMYLDVLLKNGSPLHEAQLFAENMLRGDVEESQKEAIAHALKLTALEEEERRKSKDKVKDFTPEEQIIANAYVAGEKLKAELKAKKQLRDTVIEDFQGTTSSVERSTELTVEDLVGIENAEVKIPPKEKQNTFDFVNPPHPTVPVKESDINVGVTEGPKMVDPKGDKTIKDESKQFGGGIRESSREKMGNPQEVPLRYEDRIKQSQR
jgi:hypothetical protein